MNGVQSLTPSTSGPSRGSEGGRKPRPRSAITRVRTGCFTCRKRKKKCDEQKPACGNCQKTGVVCEGFPKPELWEHRVAARRQAGRATSSVNDIAFEDPDGSTMQSPGAGTSLVEGNFSYALQPEHNLVIEPQFGGNPNDMLLDRHSATVAGGILGLSNDIGGFFDERDYNRLITANSELDLSHVLERRGYSWNQQRFIPTELPFLISGVDSDIQRRLFCHFTGVMSSLLAITVKDSNPFNSVVIPLALRDRTVMDTVLSLAGSHLAKLQQGDCDSELSKEQHCLHEAAIQIQAHRVKTLKSIPSLSGENYAVIDQEAIVATSLLLCLYEICEGTCDNKWRLHLDMARQVITAFSRSGEAPLTHCDSPMVTEAQDPIVTDINPFLLEFFLYHDSLATVTVPTLPISRAIQSTAELLPQYSYVVGVQDGLNGFIKRISTLRLQADASPKQPDGDVVCKAVLIWQDLAQWKPKAFDSFERQLIAEFYQWALFIWLFSIIYPEGKADEKVQGAVKRIADGMYNIKSGEGVMSCLLFPVFVVGSAAIRPQDREAISAHFERLKAWSSLGNIDLTYGVIQQMWNDHDRGTPRSWDWVKQLEMRGMSLLVT